MKIPNIHASIIVHPLVNRCPHFGQDFALFATTFPHLHFRIGALGPAYSGGGLYTRNGTSVLARQIVTGPRVFGRPTFP
jgi:hypothetical protein